MHDIINHFFKPNAFADISRPELKQLLRERYTDHRPTAPPCAVLLSAVPSTNGSYRGELGHHGALAQCLAPNGNPSWCTVGASVSPEHCAAGPSGRFVGVDNLTFENEKHASRAMG